MQEYLPALDRLIEHYSSFRWWQVPKPLGGMCPLCEVSDAQHTRRCVTCPWVAYGGAKCFSADFSYDRTYKRIRRLKRWRKLINNTVAIEVGGLNVEVRAENHAGFWELFWARLFGTKTKTDGVTVITYRGKQYLIDYEATSDKVTLKDLGLDRPTLFAEDILHIQDVMSGKKLCLGEHEVHGDRLVSSYIANRDGSLTVMLKGVVREIKFDVTFDNSRVQS